MRPVKSAALLLTVLMLSSASYEASVRTARTIDHFEIKVGADTLRITYGSEHVSFRPADFKTGDTVNFYFKDTTKVRQTLKLYGAADSLELQPTDSIIAVAFLSSAQTPVGRFIFQFELSTSNFVKLLRDYQKFDATVSADMTPFAYQDAHDTDLVSLRSEFDLDGIAGSGDDRSRIANLLHWVHTGIRHDGGAETKPGWTSRDLLSQGPDIKRGVNCGVLADVMNEVFLAAGFKARRVVCLPFDTADIDCHSINVVWSESLNKWVYADPTFEGMFFAPNGTPMSIAEVRQAMARGDSLIVSDQLNWNGQPKPRAEYIRYMAKNLFRFRCFTALPESERGTGKGKGSLLICLNPTGYQSDRLNRGTMDSTHSTVYTDNEQAFWARP